MPFVRIVRLIAPFIGNGQHLWPRDRTQFPKLGPLIDLVVDIAATDIGNANIEQSLYLFNNRGDYIGRPWEKIRRAHIEGLQIANKVRRPAVTQRAPIFAHFLRFAQDIIINIGDILHIAHSMPPIFQIAHENIVDDISKRMTKMGRIVGCNPTDVERNRPIW